jgi:hypothetical protein
MSIPHITATDIARLRATAADDDSTDDADAICDAVDTMNAALIDLADAPPSVRISTARAWMLEILHRIDRLGDF